MTAPCSAAWQDHVLPYAHHCGLDEGHEGLHVCAACTQIPAGRADAGSSAGGEAAARPELVTEECGPFWAHEDCEDPGCGCGCHQESGGSGS